MSTKIKATCHCGAITITAPHKPDRITECQCTLCRRYGAAWAYYKPTEVTIETREGSSPTKPYIWGDKDHGFHHCPHCGCVTHHFPVDKPGRKMTDEGLRVAINTRMINPDELKWIDREIVYDALLGQIGPKEEAHPEDPAKYD